MIDIENEVFDYVYSHIMEDFPDLYMTGEYEVAPAKLPCLYLFEADNSVRRDTISSSSVENFADVMMEAQIFSNKSPGKKQECKDILQALDGLMAILGFRRTMKQVVPNMLDATVCRMVARYEGTVSRDKIIYRR